MSEKIAVVLLQLGGPDSTEAVEPFLYNLFCDPDIIDFPGAFIARKWLARTISSKRWKPVAEHYRQIGGKSPILDLTQKQADALQATLRAQGIDATCIIAMRYWHPMTEAAVQRVRSGGFRRIILLPLYPQFSRATTQSSINEWNRQAAAQSLDLPTQFVCCYPNHPALIDALVDSINATYRRFDNTPQEEIDLLFSAHGVPTSYIKKGDPYQLHVEETVRCVVERGKWKSPVTQCYQSKVGPQQWLQPSLHDTILDLGRKGRKKLLVIPVAFVTEHIETLHEINIEERHAAMHAGIEQFEVMPALNDHPKFIQCLADLVSIQLSSSGSPSSKCVELWKEKSLRPKPLRCPWMETK